MRSSKQAGSRLAGIVLMALLLMCAQIIFAGMGVAQPATATSRGVLDSNGIYTVQSGDTYGIASRYGLAVGDLAAVMIFYQPAHHCALVRLCVFQGARHRFSGSSARCGPSFLPPL